VFELRTTLKKTFLPITVDWNFPPDPRVIFEIAVPDNVIDTGTPVGVVRGMADHPHRSPADVVELEIDGLGRHCHVFKGV
jgi:hypothetical protein